MGKGGRGAGKKEKKKKDRLKLEVGEEDPLRTD